MQRFLPVYCWLLYFSGLFGQVTLKVEKIPAGTPSGDKIYVSGSMNEWNPGNEDYELSKGEDSLYEVSFTPPAGQFKFKFTRGSWSNVEGTETGHFRPDRVAEYRGVPIVLKVTIDGWEDISSQSTASKQVTVLSDSFFMPELNAHRRIWIYLPEDYLTSGKSYNVLYMHDGQNLFDTYTSFAGEWGIDETLDSLIHTGDDGCIVIGIENGGNQRMYEYTPWTHPRYGGGGGDKYIQFIKNTLKPYVDSHFRTNPGPENTGIMGSSLGGLISFYAGMAYPETFGRVGIFSPSFWYSSRTYDLAKSFSSDSESYLYMMAGDREGAGVVKDMYDVGRILSDNGLPDYQLFMAHHADGEHSEWFWRREFPDAYSWLFEKKSLPQPEGDTSSSYPKLNYNSGHLFFKNIPDEGIQWHIYNVHGQFVTHGFSDTFTSSKEVFLMPGVYGYRIDDYEKFWSGFFVVPY